MAIKRSRAARSSDQLQTDATGANEIRPVEQSSSAIGDRNKTERRSTMANNAAKPPLPPPPPPGQRTLPRQIKFKEGGGFLLLPAAVLDSCNHCSKNIEPDGDRYMNGGLEAYCSVECRRNFNKVMQASAGRETNC